MRAFLAIGHGLMRATLVAFGLLFVAGCATLPENAMELSETVAQPATSRKHSAMSATRLNLPRVALGALMTPPQELDVRYAKSLTFFAPSNLMITVRVFCDVAAAPVDRPTLPPAVTSLVNRKHIFLTSDPMVVVFGGTIQRYSRRFAHGLRTNRWPAIQPIAWAR
jgi:hypothetical protein